MKIGMSFSSLSPGKKLGIGFLGLIFLLINGGLFGNSDPDNQPESSKQWHSSLNLRDK